MYILKAYLGTDVGVLGLLGLGLESGEMSVEESRELALIPLSFREGDLELSSSLSR